MPEGWKELTAGFLWCLDPLPRPGMGVPAASRNARGSGMLFFPVTAKESTHGAHERADTRQRSLAHEGHEHGGYTGTRWMAGKGGDGPAQTVETGEAGVGPVGSRRHSRRPFERRATTQPEYG